MAKKYRIVVDKNMPGIDKLFGDFSEIILVEGRSISNEILRDADALLCRSITQVNQQLLINTSVKFVGTATIGIDHLDIDWLDSENIKWCNAIGCNAAAVAQYVLSAMAFWCKSRNTSLQNLRVGIVGAGHVGSELARCLDNLDIDYLLCDPPLQLEGDNRVMVSMQKIRECDVITLHVPLVENGDYQTRHLFDLDELEHLTDNHLLINTSRGCVIDNKALESYLSNKQSADVVLDVYEGEPDISTQLLSQCLLTTPHIAGHTLEGKLRGSWLIYKIFCQYFEISEIRKEEDLYPDENRIILLEDAFESNLLSIYDIQSDSDALRSNTAESMATKFDGLRKNAAQLANGITRRDYSGWIFEGNYYLNNIIPLDQRDITNIL